MSTTPSRNSPRPTRPRFPHSPSSPDLARPSSLSLRPLIVGGTRLRARSITSGAGASAAVPHLSPTLEGSPTLPSLPDALKRLQELSASDTESNDGTLGGSTESDTPPVTPDDFHDAPSRFPSPVSSDHWRVEPASSDDEDDQADKVLEMRLPKPKRPFAGEQLEHSTRRSLRRGKSFTSLLAQANKRPGTPALEEGEPSWQVPTIAVFPPSAPSTEDLALPLQKKRLADFVPQFLVLSSLFVVSIVFVLGLVATLPTFFVPHALSDLPVLTSSLQNYRSSSFFAEVHLFTVLTAFFLWKQCFSIPGSILTNVLFGALYGSYIGTFWACIWTAAGSTGAYGIARIISPLVEHYFSTPLNMTRKALHMPQPGQPAAMAGNPLSREELFSYLLLARFFPLLPYSVLNVIGGVLALPVPVFFSTLVIGSFPFNFATVSIGEIVAHVASSGDAASAGDALSRIWSPEVVQKLVLATVISVLPLVFKRQLQRALSAGGLAATWTALSALPSAVRTVRHESLVEAAQGIPTQVSFALSRIKDATLRRAFGFGSVGSSSFAAPWSSIRNATSYNPVPAFDEDF